MECNVIEEHPSIATNLAIGGGGSGRTASRRAVTATAASLMLVGSLFLSSAAQAGPAPQPDEPDQPQVVEVEEPRVHNAPQDVPVTAGISGVGATTLAESLGSSRSGGVFLDESGRMVVTVTDQIAAEAVRAAGGVAQVVTYSESTLNSVQSELDKLAGIPGTSWGVDPATNQVSVELDDTVSAADTARLKAVTDMFGSAVRVERIPGIIALTEGSSGGDAIGNVEGRALCSLGFNVTDEYVKHKYFLTAGHCVVALKQWYLIPTQNHMGYRVGYSHPGNDYGLVMYENLSIHPYGTVNDSTQQITSSRNPYIGEKVSRDGFRSTDRTGTVLRTGVTVNTREGDTYKGMIETSNCAKGGDSGGPLFHGTVGLGMLTGSNGTSGLCNSDRPTGDRTYYQPLQEALNAYGLYVY
jgi:streptogrisin D